MRRVNMAEDKDRGRDFAGTSGAMKPHVDNKLPEREKKRDKPKAEPYKTGSGHEGIEKNLEHSFEEIMKTKREYTEANEEVLDAMNEDNVVEVGSLREKRSQILSKWDQQWSEFKRLFEAEMKQH